MRIRTMIGLLAFVSASPAEAPTTLKDAFRESFLIGAAVSAAITTGADDRDAAIVKTQFNSISPENELKWERIHPQPGHYSFELADRYVEFGEKNHMFIVGHNLVWHNQTPAWVFHDDKGNFVDRDSLLARMHDHIRTVVGRYKGRIQSWDVVNEALDEDGTLRQSPWLKIIGPDYLAKAFQFAHEADPAAILNYNDYNLADQPKRNGAIKLIKDLREQGVPVSVVGLQDHDHIDSPSAEAEDAMISAFAAIGVKVAITELDIDVLPRATRQQTAEVSLSVQARAELNPYAAGLPDSVQDALTKRYADLFAVFLKHKDTVARVTFWGVTDGDSWLNNWPVRGRTSYPLLFDRSGQPKPAFDAVVREAIQ